MTKIGDLAHLSSLLMKSLKHIDRYSTLSFTQLMGIILQDLLCLTPIFLALNFLDKIYAFLYENLFYGIGVFFSFLTTVPNAAPSCSAVLTATTKVVISSKILHRLTITTVIVTNSRVS